MDIIFNRQLHRLYNLWLKSPKGRIIDFILEEVIADIFFNIPNCRLLEIGCGTGLHMKVLKEMGLEVWGVDASPYMIKEARRVIGSESVLRLADAYRLPFFDNEFDGALFINTLEFLNSPQDAIREAARVSKRYIFILAVNGLSLFYLYQKFHSIFFKDIFSYIRNINRWNLLYFIRQSLGDVPISWYGKGVESSWKNFLILLVHHRASDIKRKMEFKMKIKRPFGVADAATRSMEI